VTKSILDYNANRLLKGVGWLKEGGRVVYLWGYKVVEGRE